jgi:putative transposase
VHENGNWDGDFKQYLEIYDKSPILIGIKHPQTNGKLERFFGEYK